MAKPRAVIIGAGVAGLSAALRLAEAGRYQPVLLEREDQPGGLARSLCFQDFVSDLGPHRIHTELPEVQRLIEEVAAPSLTTVRRASRLYLRGKYLRYPPSPWAAMAHLGPWRALGFGIGFVAERLRPQPRQVTYESLMRRAFGGALYEFLLGPYSAKTWKTDPALIHADTARVRISAGNLFKLVAGLLRREERGRETSLKEFRYVKGGVQNLVGHLLARAVAAGAELHLECAARRLVMDDAGRVAAVECGGSQGSPDRWSGDVFLSTAPLPLLIERLLPADLDLREARRAATGLTYLDMVFVFLIVRRRVISADHWLYFPEPQFIFNRAYEAKNFDPGMGPEDRSVLCAEITLRPGDAVWNAADDSLIRTVTEQLARTGLFAASEVVGGMVYRMPFAYPLYTLDYDQRLDAALEGLRRVPNLMTLGRQGLFNHNNMDHSIWMGLRAANLLNSRPADEAVGAWYDQAHEFKSLRIVD